MISSLFTGVTGLDSNSTAMSVIGDNIANVNTTGFKSSRTSFADLLSQSLGGSPGSQIGRGVKVWGVRSSWTQGSMETTSNPLDLAIDGHGFFMVKDKNEDMFYTRAGEFRLDKEKNLLNPDGLLVQGHKYNKITDEYGSNITGITIPSGNFSPRETSKMSTSLNLDADAKKGDTYSTTMTVYDSLGSAIPMTIDFTCRGSGKWDWKASVPNSMADSKPTEGRIAFDENGQLYPCFSYEEEQSLIPIIGPITDSFMRQIFCDFESRIGFINRLKDQAHDYVKDPKPSAMANIINRLYHAGGSNPTIEITDLANGADDFEIQWTYLGKDDKSNRTITGYASPSDTTAQTQNGYSSGVLQGISVDEDGVITGAYSNGQLSPLFKLALADFPSVWGLTKKGQTLYAESVASGQPVAGTAGNGRIGKVSANGLEMSNVDLVAEFVKLITTQRAFQANSKVITTSDQILEEVINLRR